MLRSPPPAGALSAHHRGPMAHGCGDSSSHASISSLRRTFFKRLTTCRIAVPVGPIFLKYATSLPLPMIMRSSIIHREKLEHDSYLVRRRQIEIGLRANNLLHDALTL